MIPVTKGFRRSITVHNVDLDILSDWMEASALFGDARQLPTSEMVDILIQEAVYDEQSFCWSRIEDGLVEIRRRSRLGPSFPIRVTGHRMERVFETWEETPAHSFLLMLTLAQRYDNWALVMPIDYQLQGELFERLTTESLRAQFPDWTIQPTGWSKTHATQLGSLVAQIAGDLGEVQGDLAAWTEPEAKEAGLDILCYRHFPDGNVGLPMLMLQCASGQWDVPGKLKTPDLDMWVKIIVFASRPKRAFATPFAFLRNDFRKIVAKVDGVLLDRYRIVSCKDEREWVSEELKRDLRAWVADRIGRLSEFAT